MDQRKSRENDIIDTGEAPVKISSRYKRSVSRSKSKSASRRYATVHNQANHIQEEGDLNSQVPAIIAENDQNNDNSNFIINQAANNIQTEQQQIQASVPQQFSTQIHMPTQTQTLTSKGTLQLSLRYLESDTSSPQPSPLQTQQLGANVQVFRLDQENMPGDEFIQTDQEEEVRLEPVSEIHNDGGFEETKKAVEDHTMLLADENSNLKQIDTENQELSQSDKQDYYLNLKLPGKSPYDYDEPIKTNSKKTKRGADYDDGKANDHQRRKLSHSKRDLSKDEDEQIPIGLNSLQIDRTQQQNIPFQKDFSIFDTDETFYQRGNPFTQYKRAFQSKEIQEVKNFMIADPLYLSYQFNISEIYENAFKMQDWDDNNWIEFFEKLFNFINKHEELKDQANVRKLVQEIAKLDYTRQVQIWILTAYPMLGNVIFQILSVQLESQYQKKSNLKDQQIKDAFNIMKSWKFKPTDYSDQKFQKFPGILMKKGQKFTDYLLQKDSIDLQIFADQGLFDLNKPPIKFLKIIENFQKVVNESEEKVLQQICDIINKYQCLLIKAFRFMYHNTDFSPKPCNFYEKEGRYETQLGVFTFYIRFFQGLNQMNHHKVNTSNLRNLKNVTPKEIFRQLKEDQNVLVRYTSLTNSIIFKMIKLEAANKDGLSIYGEGQLPFEAKEGGILELDIYAVGIFVMNKFNDISNNSINHCLQELSNQKETKLNDSIESVSSRNQMSSIVTSNNSVEKVKRWFDTLLNKSGQEELDKQQHQLNLNLISTSKNLDKLYIDYALTLLKQKEEEEYPGMFFAFMAKIKKNQKQVQDSILIDEIEDDCDQIQPGQTLDELFKIALDKFEYVPSAFDVPIIKWITNSRKTIRFENVQKFIAGIKQDQFKINPLPLKMLKKVNYDNDSSCIILQSNMINTKLLAKCQKYQQRIVDFELEKAVAMVGDNEEFAGWFLKQNDDALKFIGEFFINHEQDFKSFAEFIESFMKKEGTNLKVSNQLLLNILAQLGDRKLELNQFVDLDSEKWEHKYERIITDELYDTWLQEVQNKASIYLTQDIINNVAVMYEKDIEFSDQECIRCLPHTKKLLPRYWQKYLSALVRHLVFSTPHSIAKENKCVIVVSCNEFLKIQLRQNYFGETNAFHRLNIYHFQAKGKQFIDFIQSKSSFDSEKFMKKAIVIVDEIDYYAEDRLLIEQQQMTDDEGVECIRTVSLDILKVLSKFQKVISFSSQIPSYLLQSIQQIDPDGQRIPLDFGTVKGSGLKSKKTPQCIPRTGVLRQNFFDDTLGQILLILKEPNSPRCIYVLHNFKDQVQKIKDELLKKHLQLIDGRTVLHLADVDDASSSTNVINQSFNLKNDSKGFIFITTSKASRGVNIKGITPACVIINYKYSSGTDLLQSLGRGNRSLDQISKAESYVFYDKNGDAPISFENMSSDNNQVWMTEQEKAEKLISLIDCLDVQSLAKEYEQQDLDEDKTSFADELNSHIGKDNQLLYRAFAEFFVFSIHPPESIFDSDKFDTKDKETIMQKLSNKQGNQNDLIEFVKDLSSSDQLDYFFTFIKEAIDRHNYAFLMIQLLKRGTACAFPILSQAKKYRTHQIFDILVAGLTEAKKISRFQIFSQKVEERLSTEDLKKQFKTLLAR